MEFVNNQQRKEKAREIEALKKALIKKGVLSEADIEKERKK
jgi:hypothetical protein